MRNYLYLAGIVVLVAIGASQAFALQNAGSAKLLAWIGIPTLVLAGIGVARAQRDGELYRRSSFDEGGGLGWLNVRSGDFTRGFAGAAVLFGGAWGFTKVVMPTGSPREAWAARMYLQLGDTATLRKEVWFVAIALIVMAIAEELLWRGFATSLLSEVVGSSRAWVWSAVLYAVAHIPSVWALKDPGTGSYNPMILVAALSCGLAWGFMARRFERLFPSIVSHALFDWTVLMMFRLWGPSV